MELTVDELPADRVDTVRDDNDIGQECLLFSVSSSNDDGWSPRRVDVANGEARQPDVDAIQSCLDAKQACEFAPTSL